MSYPYLLIINSYNSDYLCCLIDDSHQLCFSGLKVLFVASVIFIVGVGGMVVSFGAVEIRTVACALILGILTNLMLSGEKDEEA